MDSDEEDETMADVLRNQLHVNTVESDIQTERLFVRGTLNTLECDMLIDSGSDVNIMAENIWRRLGKHDNNNIHRPKLHGYAGSAEVIAIADLAVSVGETLVQERFYISPVKHVNVLGIPSMKKVQAVLACIGKPALYYVYDNKLMPYDRTDVASTTCKIFSITTDKESMIKKHPTDIQQLLNQNTEIWTKPLMGKCKLTEHKINLRSES